jgi:DNA-binding transcriptional MocR family regulator
MTNCETNPENLMSSTGNSQALDYLISTLFEKGDNFFMEVPTYHLFTKIALDRKLNVK